MKSSLVGTFLEKNSVNVCDVVSFPTVPNDTRLGALEHPPVRPPNSTPFFYVVAASMWHDFSGQHKAVVNITFGTICDHINSSLKGNSFQWFEMILPPFPERSKEGMSPLVSEAK